MNIASWQKSEKNYFTSKDHASNVNLCIYIFRPFTFTSMKGVKNWFVQCKRHILIAYLDCNETHYSATIRSFDRCHLSNLIYSKCFGVLPASWQISLRFCKHTVGCESHKSRPKFHILHMPDFGSAGKFNFLLGFVKYLGPWVCYFPWQPQNAQFLQGPDEP